MGWFVTPDKFWALSKQYRSLPIGEKIAWQAASDIACSLNVVNVTIGQYLALYPKGKHAKAAFEEVIFWISPNMDVINGGDEPYYMGVGNDKDEQRAF
ncbi:MAG: hypothetical protein ABFS56_15715 [Pseudomonadota bacterium]